MNNTSNNDRLRYNRLCEYTKTGWLEFNLRSEEVCVDEYLQGVLGVPCSSFDMMEFEKLLIPEERAFFAVMIKLLKRSHEFHQQLHICSGDEVVLVEIELRDMKLDDNGEVISAGGVMQISPEVKELSGSLLRAILKHLPIYLFVRDVKNDSRYLYCSPMMRTVFRDYSVDPVGKTDEELHGSAELAEFFRAKDLELVETGAIQNYVETVIDSKGEPRVLEITKVLLDSEPNNPRTLGMAFDVSEFKRMEEKLLESNLRIGMACKVGMIHPFTWDVKECCVHTLEVKDGDFIQNIYSYDTMIENIYPDDQHEVEYLLRLLCVGKINFARITFRASYKEDQAYRWYEMIAEPYEFSSDNSLSKVTGLLRNVTETKRNEEIYEEVDKMKTAFLANMSHEIRTPLNLIIGFSSMLAYAHTNEERNEYVKIIEKNSGDLLQLVDNILDISRIESGDHQFEFADFWLDQIFVPLQQIYQNQALPGVEVIFESSEKDCHIISDQNRLHQVVCNFMDNAVKFTEKGTIRFGYKTTAIGIYVYVSDTGCGISKEKRSTIFERFAKVNDFIQGSGLGLSICKTIISIFNGEIGVESEEGVGSTFWFSIPCKFGFNEPTMADFES